MLTTSLLSGARSLTAAMLHSRNLSLAAPALAKATDPIQQLFVDKLKEYKQKSAGGKLVDASPEIQKELKTELEKLEKQYGGGAGVDMTQFPTFKFDEPKLDPIDLSKE